MVRLFWHKQEKGLEDITYLENLLEVTGPGYDMASRRVVRTKWTKRRRLGRGVAGGLLEGPQPGRGAARALLEQRWLEHGG